MDFDKTAYRCTKRRYKSTQANYEKHATICKLCQYVPFQKTFKKYNVVMACNKFVDYTTKPIYIKHLKTCLQCMNAYKSCISDIDSKKTFPLSLKQILNKLVLEKTTTQSKETLDGLYRKYYYGDDEVSFRSRTYPSILKHDMLKNYYKNLQDRLQIVEKDLITYEVLEKEYANNVMQEEKLSMLQSLCYSFVYCHAIDFSTEFTFQYKKKIQMLPLDDDKKFVYKKELLTGCHQICFDFQCIKKENNVDVIWQTVDSWMAFTTTGFLFFLFLLFDVLY